MNISESKNIYVKPSNVNFKIGPESVLMEKVESRENSVKGGSNTFEISSKGENSLLVSVAYMGVTVSITKTKGDGLQAKLTRDLDSLAIRCPLSLIQSAVVNYNGTSLTCSMPDNEVLSYIHNDNEDMKKHYHRGYTNWAHDYKRADMVVENVLNRKPRLDLASGNDNARAEAIHFMNFRMKESDADTATFEVLIPLNIPPFNFNKKGMFRNMSDVLPYFNGSLQVQYYPQIKGLILETLSTDLKIDGTGTPATYDVDFKVDTKANLYLKWYTSPKPLDNVYNISSWSSNHYPNTTGITALVADGNTTAIPVQFTARVQEKFDYIGFWISPNKSTSGAATRTTYNCAAMPNCPILNLELTIDNNAGVVQSNLNSKLLRRFTKENCVKQFPFSDEVHRQFRDFVFLRADQLSKASPGGMVGNTTIQATLNFHRPYTPHGRLMKGGSLNDSYVDVNPVPYIAYMGLYSEKQIITITRDSCVIRKQGLNPEAFQRLSVTEGSGLVSAGSIKTAGTVLTAGRERFGRSYQSKF